MVASNQSGMGVTYSAGRMETGFLSNLALMICCTAMPASFHALFLVRGRRCVVYVLRVLLAAVVYRKIALADKLLDSAAIRYGDKAGYLIVL